SAGELDRASADLRNEVVFGLGCHAGFTIPNQATLPLISPDPDWPEALARRGMVYIGSTGYAYGDTELTEYGERFMVNLARQLRTGRGPVPLGQALMLGKQTYLEQKLSLSGLDEKTLIESVMYGLPMLMIDMPGERIQADDDLSLVSAALPVS